MGMQTGNRYGRARGIPSNTRARPLILSEDEQKSEDKVNAKISQLDVHAQRTMSQIQTNVLQAADRNLSLADLEEQSQQLEDSANQFEKGANQQKWTEYRKMVYSYMWFGLLFVGITMLILWWTGV